MKNKGFTLIELIGVIIIIGMLILIVFPSTVRLIKGNSEKKFNQYYELIIAAGDLYANSRRDDLGGATATGCIDDVTLADLIDADYIKEYDEENVICGSPSQFNLEDYDIDSTKDYVDIKITNNKGKISTEASLLCVKGKKVSYSKLIEDNGVCNKYVAQAENVLYDAITNLATTTDDNQNYFITGTNPNNYVFYSGKMWRIVSYNQNDKTIKLVSDEIVTLLPFDSLSSNYPNSNIDIWLNQTFLSTLRSPDLYLANTSWNYTAVADTNKPLDTNVLQSKVGLLNYYEFNKGKEYLTTSDNWWLLSMVNSNNVWYVSSTSALEASINNYYGIRPSIVLKANISYVSGGEGTESNPYKLEGDSSANSGTFLNTRYAGEYVMFAGIKYRIIETDANYTRLIADANLSSITTVFDDINVTTYNAGAKIGNLLNNEWLNNFSESDKEKLVVSDFCTSIFNSTTKYSSTCPNSDIVNITIGIPKLGDMYTIPSASGEYWTLTNSSTDTINTISSTGIVTGKAKDYVAGVRPVINLKNNVQIASGNGTNANPYILQ